MNFWTVQVRTIVISLVHRLLFLSFHINYAVFESDLATNKEVTVAELQI